MGTDLKLEWIFTTNIGKDSIDLSALPQLIGVRPKFRVLGRIAVGSRGRLTMRINSETLSHTLITPYQVNIANIRNKTTSAVTGQTITGHPSPHQ